MQFIAPKIRQIIALARQSGQIAPDQCLSIAGSILNANPLPPEFAQIGVALIRQAALFNPYDHDTVQLAADVNKQAENPAFTKWLGTALHLSQSDPTPSALPFPDTESASAKHFVTYIAQQQANANRLPALLHLWQSGERDALLMGMEILSTSPSGLLAAPLLAWGAYAAGDVQRATALINAAEDTFIGHNLMARLALDDGDVDSAKAHLVASLEAEPFQPGTMEQLAELAAEPSGSAPGSDTHICLYTWNKPDLLAGTIASLAQTDIGAARVTILNNGTTDCSPEELEDRVRGVARSMEINWVHLPINIGAPAARNWLLDLPGVRRAKYVAFLDDDVLLPQHWLTRYLDTLKRFPQAAAVGPKCVNRDLRTIQYAFRGFEEVGERKIRFTANAPTLMDLGQFDAARPCLTVMGCCHLLNMDRMTERGVPGFDIRFSPSQVDDIEHDLQIWKAGGQVIYDGGVPVVHLQDTGKTRTEASGGQAYANHFKMEAKFTLDELTAMNKSVKDADTAHFSRAVATALPLLGGTARQFWQRIGPALS